MALERARLGGSREHRNGLGRARRACALGGVPGRRAFPRAEFQSTAVEPSDQHLLVRGRLQLHGVTHDLDLEVETGTGKDGAARYVYSVRGKIDRQRFGLHWNQDLDAGGAVVGDEIEMSAEVSVMRAGDGPD